MGLGALVSPLEAELAAFVVAIGLGRHLRPAGGRRRRPPARVGRRRLDHLPLLAVGAAALAAFVVAGPVLAIAVGVAGALARQASARSDRRRWAAARERSMPELVDLFLLAASAGVPVATALPMVAPRSPPPLADDLARAAAVVARGGGVATSLAQLGADLGPDGDELVRALSEGARTGAPLAPVLREVAATARDRRTRRAEERARRLPVSMLFPLACCVLPAAVLVALVPVVVASLGSLAARAH